MNYAWTYASLTDATELLELSLKVQYEVDTIFNFNPNVLAHQIVLGLVNQYYTGRTDLLAIVRHNNKIIAYTWCRSGEKSMWSAEELINVRMAHVDPDLTDRQKISLLKDMLEIWERFAQITNTPIIASSTLRHKQTAFLRLHERAGYTVRGSTAYRRVDLSVKPATLF